MRRILSFLLIMVLVAGLAATSTVKADSRMWQLELQRMKYEESGDTQALKPVYSELAILYEQAGNWINVALMRRSLGGIYANEKNYDQAVVEYDAASAAWSREGKVDEAINEKRYADAMRTTAEVFVTLKAETIGQQYYTGAKYEPIYGAYLGMYAEADSNVYDSVTYRPDRFYTELVPKVTGKKHAGYLLYADVNQGQFPTSHAENAKRAGTFLQIAMQPSQGMASVKDNTWLRSYARAVKASGIPVFIRFACEMNDPSAIAMLGGTPEEYIAKWRLVANVFHQEAPNAVMVWSPNWFPPYTIETYYPGDEYVDWVGMSVYHMPDASWDPEHQQDRGEILQRLHSVYDLYADRKPIMLSETAISFYNHTTGESYEDWGIANMRRFYAGLPRLFPRVKALFWWDVDHSYARYAEANNQDFTITGTDRRLQAYREAISSPYFLSDISEHPAAPAAYQNVAEAGLPVGDCELSAHIKPFDPIVSRVEYSINGKLIGTATAIPYTIRTDTTAYAQQTVRLGIKAYDRAGRVSGQREIDVKVGAAQVTLNGRKLEFDVNPVSQNSRVLVPLRKIVESLGAQVGWDNGRVTITRGSIVVALNDGDPVILRNGQAVRLDSAPVTERGRMMVPVRAVTESFGLQVAWDETTKTVALTQ
ncbi:MAG: stalk domain-containing protein [Bacillota bacterium]